MSELRVTTFEDLQQYSLGEIVELPPFDDGRPFVARLRRPSMSSLMAAGKLPNSLMEVALNMFDTPQANSKKKDKSMSTAEYKELLELYEAVCSAAFVEPTWAEVKQSGVFLTNEQYNYIMDYTQGNVSALKSFRE